MLHALKESVQVFLKHEETGRLAVCTDHVSRLFMVTGQSQGSRWVRANGKMRGCGPTVQGSRVRVWDKVRLGLAMVLVLAHCTFRHISSPPHPRRPTFYPYLMVSARFMVMVIWCIQHGNLSPFSSMVTVWTFYLYPHSVILASYIFYRVLTITQPSSLHLFIANQPPCSTLIICCHLSFLSICFILSLQLASCFTQSTLSQL